MEPPCSHQTRVSSANGKQSGASSTAYMRHEACAWLAHDIKTCLPFRATGAEASAFQRQHTDTSRMRTLAR